MFTKDFFTALMSLTFNFFSTSYFVQTLTSSVFPAELALLKFNLTDGNYEDMSILVNPGDLPMGMAAEAKNHSEKTHRRSLPPNTDGETDYKKIFAQMMNFLGCYEKDQKTPPLFVESGMKEENLKVAKLTLKLIAEKVGEDLNCFRVLPIEVLLFKLNKMRAMSNKNFKEYSAKPFNSILIAKEMVARDDFLYYDIGCDFHREHNISHHCCLAKVRRHGFTISQYCLDDKRDKKIPGRHFPYNHATTDDSASSSNFSGVGWKSKKTMSDSFKEFRMRFCGRSSIVTSGRSTPLTSGLTTSDVPSERHSMRYAESVASEHPTVKEAEQSDVAEDENDVEVAKLMGNLTTQAVPADPSDVLSTASTSAQSFQYEQLKNEESSNGSRRPILTADISFETISASFSSGVPTNLWFLRRGSRNMLPRRGRP